MKKIASLILAGSILACSPIALKAQSASPITVSNMSPQIRGIVQNVKTELGLNANQATKFTNDYLAFLNNNAKNLSANAGNKQKMDEETKKLLLQTGTKFRSYLNDGQFTKLTQMIQQGKLDPAKYSGPTSSVNTNVAAPVQQVAAKPAAGIPAAVSIQSNVAGIFEQLVPYMNVTADQSAKALPILREYDQKAMAIKKGGGNVQGQLNTLNAQTISQLKPVLNDDQIRKLVMAATMQENILSGRNLSMDQKAFLQRLQSQYGLNDVQTMAVVLVMVEGKVRGDAIHQLSKSNPQAAAQELGKLLGDLDMRLKSALSNDQYAKVRSDIEKLIKGQKI
jgi:hypothetical protein